jgi:hypothetical protein
MQNTFEQYRTLMHHRVEEERFPPNVEYLIHDGNTLTPYFYAALYAQKDDPKERLVIQDMYAVLLDDLYSRKYDLIYFLPRIRADTAGSTFDDGTRVQTPAQVDLIERHMGLLLTELHKFDNIRVLNCPLGKRNEILIGDILGDEAIVTWKSLREKEIAHVHDASDDL